MGLAPHGDEPWDHPNAIIRGHAGPTLTMVGQPSSVRPGDGIAVVGPDEAPEPPGQRRDPGCRLEDFDVNSLPQQAGLFEEPLAPDRPIGVKDRDFDQSLLSAGLGLKTQVIDLHPHGGWEDDVYFIVGIVTHESTENEQRGMWEQSRARLPHHTWNTETTTSHEIAPQGHRTCPQGSIRPGPDASAEGAADLVP